MEASRRQPKRRRFNESRITRMPSSTELEPGTRRALQLRPLLPLDALRASLRESLGIMRLSSLISALLSVMYITIVFVESEWTNSKPDWSKANVARGSAAFLAFTQVVLSVIYYKASLRIRQLRGVVSEETKLTQDSTLPWLLLESAVLMLVVPPYLQSRQLLGQLMLGLSFLRAFTTIHLWHAYSHVLEPRETFFCELHLLSKSRFLTKCLLREHPVLFLLFAVWGMCALAGLLLRVFEVHQTSIRSLYDSLWLVAYTQCTIGYGDVTAETHFGRFVCVAAGVTGGMTLSMMINVLKASTQLSMREKVFLVQLYSRQRVCSRLPSLAIILIQRWRRLLRARRWQVNRLTLLRRFNCALVRFRLRFSLLVSKENPEVDELIHRVHSTVTQEFGAAGEILRPVKLYTRCLGEHSTKLSRFTIRLLAIRSQARRLATVLMLSTAEPTRVNRFTWSARTNQVSKIAQKRNTDKVCKRVRSRAAERDSASRASLELGESVSTQDF